MLRLWPPLLLCLGRGGRWPGSPPGGDAPFLSSHTSTRAGPLSRWGAAAGPRAVQLTFLRSPRETERHSGSRDRVSPCVPPRRLCHQLQRWERVLQAPAVTRVLPEQPFLRSGGSVSSFCSLSSLPSLRGPRAPAPDTSRCSSLLFSLNFAADVAREFLIPVPEEWVDCAKKVKVPFDAERNYHPEYDGYSPGGRRGRALSCAFSTSSREVGTDWFQRGLHSCRRGLQRCPPAAPAEGLAWRCFFCVLVDCFPLVGL